jgi:hypothetical protein
MIPDALTWPEGWCESFKYGKIAGTKSPPEAKMIIFHGLPKPDQAIAGVHKWEPTPWIKNYWIV